MHSRMSAHFSAATTVAPSLPIRVPTQEIPRILFAISASEKALFFDGRLPLQNSAKLHTDWCPQDGTHATLASKLREFQPHILVTGWSTSHALPEWLSQPNHSARYICHLTGTVRNLVPRSFIERGGIVTNWGPLAGETVAEHALLLALGALRNLPRWGEIQTAPPGTNPVIHLQTQSLYRRRVGIHGFGAVARALLKLIAPFTNEVAIYSEGVPHELIEQHGAKLAPSLDALFAESEVLFECESLTPLTEKIITRELLAKLPDGATIVNVGRGRLIDEKALLQEAASQRLRVALDVFVNEPLNPASPWAKIKGPFLSPHIGGPSADCYPRFGAFTVANIDRYLTGEIANLEAVVTLPIYDRTT